MLEYVTIILSMTANKTVSKPGPIGARGNMFVLWSTTTDIYLCVHLYFYRIPRCAHEIPSMPITGALKSKPAQQIALT